MARYLSQYGAFKITVRRGQSTLVHGSGGPIVHEVVAPHIAFFRKAGVTAWERDFAVKHFGFRGVGDGEDPIDRISSYDTEEEAQRLGWSDEEKQRVEQFLDAHAAQTTDYFRVEKPALPAPWPKYDELLPAGRRTAELVAIQIAETVQNLGLDPDGVIAYERENRNRDEVINALMPETELVVTA